MTCLASAQVFLHASTGSTEFFLTEVLFFCKPPVSPIVWAGDIGQVSTASSSIYLSNSIYLKYQQNTFLLSKSKSPQEISKKILRKHIQKCVVFSETYIQKDMLLLTSAHGRSQTWSQMVPFAQTVPSKVGLYN